MLQLSDQDQRALAAAVHSAAARVEVRAAIEGLYIDVQREIDLRKPRCDASGRCCRFEEFGHRLFVTTLELAAFVRAYQEGEAPAEPSSGLPEQRLGRSLPLPLLADPGGCPFQVDRLCSVHAIRPFGCRIFFCDPTSEAWQNERYELFHAELKRLHEQLGVPYFYVEWRSALGALGWPGKVVLSRT